MTRLKNYTTTPPGMYPFRQTEGIAHKFEAIADIFDQARLVMAFRAGNNLPRATLAEAVEDIDKYTCERLGSMGKWCQNTDKTFQESPPSKLKKKPGCCGRSK